VAGIKLSILTTLLPVILVAMRSVYGIHVVTHYMEDTGNRVLSDEEHREPTADYRATGYPGGDRQYQRIHSGEFSRHRAYHDWRRRGTGRGRYRFNRKRPDVSVAISVLMVFIIAALSSRSAAAGIVTAVPLAITILCNFAAMGFLGIKLNIGTALIASLAVGIGIDCTIHIY
jgi:predicted RND superfamily exporter protein